MLFRDFLVFLIAAFSFTAIIHIALLKIDVFLGEELRSGLFDLLLEARWKVVVRATLVAISLAAILLVAGRVPVYGGIHHDL